MEIVFKIGRSSEFSKNNLNDFLVLLKEQGQVLNPDLDKIKLSKTLCVVYWDNKPIGIGAIKQVYKTPFVKAKVHELAEKFDYELGYLYIVNNNVYRGIGLGKTICRLLMKSIGDENIFATTEENEKNPMKHILTNLGFYRAGQTYQGRKTNKKIALYVKSIQKAL